MKKIIALFIIISFFQIGNSQSKLQLSVLMPEANEEIGSDDIAKLETKLSRIVVNSGNIDAAGGSNVVIFPKIDINTDEVVEGGMQNINVVKGELNLFIKQYEANTTFSTLTTPFKGSGNNKYKAITNGITSLDTKNPNFKKFFEEAKSKVIKYYDENCALIQKKADKAYQTKNYPQALALLSAVPEETKCYEQVNNKMIQVFNAYQASICNSIISEAKSYIAVKDYSNALTSLSNIDPSSKCYPEANNLIASIDSKITAEEKRQWDFTVSQYKDEVSLEKARIKAIGDVASAYFKSQQTNINLIDVR